MIEQSGVDVLRIGELGLSVRRSARRKTVGITVERDGALVVSLPVDFDIAQAEEFVRRKLPWIYEKTAIKDDLLSPPRPKEYVTGEGHFYLGRSYRLQLVDPSNSVKKQPPLRLSNGRFLLHRDERERASEHFVRWYIEHGLPHIQRKVALYSERIGTVPKSISILDLGFRWGECGSDGDLETRPRTGL